MEDHDACNLIALSVGSVMRQSLNDGFKAECKELLGATNTKMVEEILYKKLMEKIQTGRSDSTQNQPNAMNRTSSSTIQEEPSCREHAIFTTSSTIATSTTSGTIATSTTSSTIAASTTSSTNAASTTSSTIAASTRSSTIATSTRSSTIATSTTSSLSMIATNTETPSTTIQRHIRLSEMYCQTVQLQKHSLSLLPASKPVFKCKRWKGSQSSAPF